MSKRLKIAPKVLKLAKDLGFLENTTAQIKYMAEYSAPCTHAQGNRRYEDIVLRVENDMILNIAAFEAPELPKYSTKKYKCSDCNADGGYCCTCNSTGYVTGF